MKKGLIPAVALVVAVAVGQAPSAKAGQQDGEKTSVTALVPNPDHAAAMARYNQQLADYRKDLAAYEADPTVWTVAIPREPVKPVAPETVIRQAADTAE